MISKLFKKKIQRIPIEMQLSKLEEIGISLNSDIKISKIFDVVELKDIENEPYIYLLIALGSEIEISDGQWISISDDILHLDTECIEDSGIYIEIIERLRKISRGYINLDNIKDYVDVESNKAWISFNFNEKFYKWDLEVEDDWFDMALIQKLNQILTEYEYEKKFAVTVLDQTCLIGFFNKEQQKKITRLTGLKFEFY